MPELTHAAEKRRWTVFISWSGEASLAVAKVLRQWLRSLVQSVDPWISPEIAAGERWQMALGGLLSETKYGVLCVTRDNLNAPWLTFEAGVMARSLDQSRVVPILFGVTASDLTGPLSQFQSLLGDRAGIYKLVRELHVATDSGMPETELALLFDSLWPLINKGIAEAQRDTLDQQPLVRRSDREILDEVLEVVRGLRVVPTEHGILTALRVLEAEVQAEIDRLEKEEEILTRSDAPISLEERAIEPLRRRRERLRTATTALDGTKAYVTAAATSIIWLEDVLRAVHRLESDLQGRELALDLRSSTGSSLYQRILLELDQAAKLVAFMRNDLGIQSTEG